MVNLLLLWITFDSERVAFNLPFINHPIAWYGCIFSLAFYVGYKFFIWIYTRHILSNVQIPKNLQKEKVPSSFIFNKASQKLYTFFLSRCSDKDSLERLKLKLYLEQTSPEKVPSIKSEAVKYAESALLYIIAATIIGSRLGHIIFYEDISTFIHSPSLIFKTWEGGLASHGGIIAILLTAYIFTKKTKIISFLTFMDLISAPTMFVCAWIRIGNFINQEILGDVSTLPWAIIFLNPADGGAVLPRHPMQLYEFFLYAAVCSLLFLLWRKNTYKKLTGLYTGLGLTISFSVRFFLEFLKTPQSIHDYGDSLQIGQLLSIPMILIGMALIYRALRTKQGLDKKVSEH